MSALFCDIGRSAVVYSINRDRMTLQLMQCKRTLSAQALSIRPSNFWRCWTDVICPRPLAAPWQVFLQHQQGCHFGERFLLAPQFTLELLVLTLQLAKGSARLA